MEQQLDYSVANTKIKNMAASENCQRCGRKSVSGVCPVCHADSLKGLSPAPPKLYAGMIRKATTDGLFVKINGKHHQKCNTLIEANLLCGSLNRSFAPGNIALRSLIGMK